ncbi:MAG: FAD-binding oxidoreductase [Caulobacter sp.]
MKAHDVSQLLDDLRGRFGERLTTAQAVREAHGRDESWHHPEPPDAVVFPESTEEVADIVRACAAHRTPIIPFGAGTSLEGHVAAPFGGVCLDLSRMTRILEVNTQDLDCRVEAGVTRKTLNAWLRDTGLFFPIDPGADATLGGMAATRASGTNAVRYGTMRENVLNLTAVLADGSIVRTGRRARKSSAGYDMTRLLVGSEGTLGVITEVTVRLYGLPEKTVAGLVAFDTVGAAVEAVIEAIQMGLPVARIELLDSAQIAACNRYSGLSMRETPTLFVEFHGAPEAVREQVELFGAIIAGNGGGALETADDAEGRARLWAARHDALYAAKALAPGKMAMITDVCVPISRLSACIEETLSDVAASGLVAPIAGHVGDGNFHLIMLIDPADADEVARGQQLHDRMVRRALAADGTCTGEHGIGMGKRGFLREEAGDEGVAMMRAVKAALDPHNIMNPGKIIGP